MLSDLKEIDGGQVERVLSGQEPFDEATMIAHHHGVEDTKSQAVQAAV